MSVRALRLLAGLTAAVVLAGCSAPSIPSGSAGGLTPSSVRPDRTGSWMDPAAAKQDLFYVSDSDGSVDVFGYPGGKQVGSLKGFQSPAGLCTDASGDVYVVDTNDLQVLEYKHGGVKSVRTLYTFGYYPFGCAVDPASGDVAVANIASQTQGPGSVSIFAPGQGFPSSYVDPDFGAYLFCAYDGHGDLFVDGANPGTTKTLVAELSGASDTFTSITLDKNIGYPGGVQWQGSELALQDAQSRTLYRFKIAGSTGKTAGTTHFRGDGSTLIHQFAIDGKTIVMPYGTAARIVRKVGFWPFPAGGLPSQSITVAHAVELVGIAISLAR